MAEEAHQHAQQAATSTVMTSSGVPESAAATETSAAAPATATAVPVETSSVDPATRILRKGDLVRVAERRGKRVKNRDGGLGRIHRSIPHDGEHPFRYVVDFVLGGRISNVDRSELVYTTADAEGLTEDASTMRARRKRNPSVKKQQEAAQEAAPKKKAPAKKKTAGSKRKAKETKKTTKKLKKETPTDEGPSTLDMYERHRREFERCVARLEKQDIYGYFLGDVPPEFQEHYFNDDETASSTKSTAAPVFPDTPPFNFVVLKRRMELGRFVLDRVEEREDRMRAIERQSRRDKTNFTSSPSPLIHPKGVHWNLFRHDVVSMCDAAISRDPEGVNGGPGTLGHAADKIKTAMEETFARAGRRQMQELEHSESSHKFANLLKSIENKEAAMQGKWRRNPFPERKYERLSSNVVCSGLSALDECTAINELQTSLPDSFVGLAYTYNDTSQSESWMKSVIDEAGTPNKPGVQGNEKEQERKAALELKEDGSVIRAQVQATMTTLLIGVQDRVMTQAGVLTDPELKSANWEGTVCDEYADSFSESPDLVEQPVWGIDCYTRKNITTCIEKDFSSDIALEFIEKWLLPAINACPVDLASNMSNAARILEGISLPSKKSQQEEITEDSGDERWSHSLLGMALKDKITYSGPPWLKHAAHQLREAIRTLGPDFFRIHPKGHGSVVLKPNLKANTLVTFYRGEVYPAWRWCEKMDAIELTQTRLGARPQLPDFYNMALERPQVDPRGYGLLFVDASRKAGHGSSLSHSCVPTCEVRVAAVGGKLCLAMTTVRELEIGEELTFDYNAVTESLNEYRSAVCLCGHGRCRGSFIHFATADCYQQVLNRNCPIAVRVSSLIKGCTKQVMSEADEIILSNHGFGTAAFGAVSFQHNAEHPSAHERLPASMENVPVWLRTYVGDTLRYIEYERRALPVALLCNHLDNKDEVTDGSTDTGKKKPSKTKETVTEGKAAKRNKKSNVDRPIPGSKPENVFMFFARKKAGFFRSKLEEQGIDGLSGLQVQQAMQKVAGSCWRALSEKKKQFWKDQAILEWEKNGGREKAQLEEERLKNVGSSKPAKSRKRAPEGGAEVGGKKTKKRKVVGENEGDAVRPPRISFEAADAEGVSAMEQRIHQLTQALSRTGRVLDRHRESTLQTADRRDANLKDIHPPLANLSDEDVVHWIWHHEKGVVRSLLAACRSEKCVSPSLLSSLESTERKYAALISPQASSEPNNSKDGVVLTASQARTNVTSGLLEFRANILDGLRAMEAELKCYELADARRKAKVKRDAAKKREQEEKQASVHVVGEEGIEAPPESLSEEDDARSVVSSVLTSILDAVILKVEPGNQVLDSSHVDNKKRNGSHGTETFQSTKVGKQNGTLHNHGLREEACTAKYADERRKEKVSVQLDGSTNSTSTDELTLSSWASHSASRWKLEAAADLLLFYAHTSTFFAIKPYTPLDSTPIEVYARELGNSVPRSLVETARDQTQTDEGSIGEDVNNNATSDGLASSLAKTAAISEPAEYSTSEQKPSKSKKRFCEPDDIITNVTIRYQGDFVLSQLLQWYNGGIGQKAGLPDMLGCVSLPSMSGCWHDLQGMMGRSTKAKATRYATEVRPLLLDWLENPRKRGSPFPEKISAVFAGNVGESTWNDAKFDFPPLGSPVLDLLVTGDDTSIRAIATGLAEKVRPSGKKSTTAGGGPSRSTGLQSTVDKGMPAQAVANWVQCENPDCLKWRRVPWHVDVDALPEKFYCSDNKWNPAASSCEAPEDEWDAYDEQLRNSGIAKDTDAKMVSIPCEDGKPPGDTKDDPESLIDPNQFMIGARFDVLRTNKRGGKSYFRTAVVMNTDFNATPKRVLFHFSNLESKFDEWLDVDSSRIAPLFSKQELNKTKSDKTSTKAPKTAKEKSTKKGSVTEPDNTKQLVSDKPSTELSQGTENKSTEKKSSGKVDKVTSNKPPRKPSSKAKKDKLASTVRPDKPAAAVAAKPRLQQVPMPPAASKQMARSRLESKTGSFSDGFSHTHARTANTMPQNGARSVLEGTAHLGPVRGRTQAIPVGQLSASNALASVTAHQLAALLSNNTDVIAQSRMLGVSRAYAQAAEANDFGNFQAALYSQMPRSTPNLASTSSAAVSSSYRIPTDRTMQSANVRSSQGARPTERKTAAPVTSSLPPYANGPSGRGIHPSSAGTREGLPMRIPKKERFHPQATNLAFQQQAAPFYRSLPHQSSSANAGGAGLTDRIPRKPPPAVPPGAHQQRSRWSEAPRTSTMNATGPVHPLQFSVGMAARAPAAAPMGPRGNGHGAKKFTPRDQHGRHGAGDHPPPNGGHRSSSSHPRHYNDRR